MKAFLFILGLVAAGILGYSFEPQFRLSLTGKTPGEKPVTTDPGEAPAPAPAAKPGFDPASIPADRLPAKVLLKAEAEIVDATSDLRMKVSAGNRMNLIRLEGADVVISPGPGPFEGRVPIEKTDLMEQLAATQDTAPSAEPVPMPAEPVTPPPAEPTPEPAPAPEPAPEPIPEPEPEPAVEPAPAPAPAGSGDPVAIMKASIQAGEIKEFTSDQVLEWAAGEGPETIDGQSYQIGIVSYKAETVFGVKTIKAKALIQGGKVTRWVWLVSGMEIK
jgi:hypothetical protein